jgi:ATP-binding protein involved in chromosome partitioning
MGADPTAAEVLAALSEIQDPETGRNAVQQGQLRDVTATGEAIGVTLALTTHSAPLRASAREEVEQTLRKKYPSYKIEVRDAIHERPPVPLGQFGLMAKTVIAVGSGKGGVGKSTMAAGIAYGLHRAGCKVGLLDADVYGPSVPQLLGLNGSKMEPEEDGRFKALELDGMKVQSIGFGVAPGQPIVWRGPMLHGAISQMLGKTNWGPLDYLIIDMPPGTGDIALSLSQVLPLSGAVIVCTPQDVALIDAVRAVAMFKLVNIPVLGMIENMSYFLCPDNGKRYDIFGHGGAKAKAEELNLPFLGEVPINIQIRLNGDEGKLAGNFTNVETEPFFQAITAKLARQLSNSAKVTKPLPSLSILK